MIFKKKRDDKDIFALPSASISLDIKLGLKSSNRAAICIKESSGNFRYALDEIRGFFEVSKELSYREVKDRYGYIWFIITADGIEELVASIDAIADIVIEHGFEDNILAAIFEFVNSHKMYLFYRFKSKRFYPFIPYDSNRNVDEEMRVYAVMKKELPMEEDMEKWYPIWNMPL
ncbi:MAG: hypothetical protein KatS3mg003_1218 [Candidatus Nitrosocaldaceae archaeon]|nr:MAG: hypothetical protein KatS3mg003_1218 [Candidatus Nitrosocaldaceae archaeon]